MLIRCGLGTLPMLALLLLTLCATSQAADRVDWLTGAALQKKLEQAESVAWSGQSLREALNGFARAHRVGLLIDRRIDPGQPLEVSLSNTPLWELMSTVAQKCKADVSLLDTVVYFGPSSTSARLRTVVELRKQELSQVPRTRRLSWSQAKPMRWEDFATPRDLLAALANEGKFTINNLQSIPHDLWAAADLPPLDMVERLSLVLAQFDLTWRLEPDGSITLVPLPTEVWLERTYPGGSKAAELAEKLRAALPGAVVNVADGRLVVRGTVEQHEQIDSGVIRKPRASPVVDDTSLERKTFTLTATNKPVRAILQSFEQQLGLELKIDAEKLRQAGLDVNKLVSVAVKDATLDETLKAVLSPAGLTFRRTGKTVEIEPAK